MNVMRKIFCVVFVFSFLMAGYGLEQIVSELTLVEKSESADGKPCIIIETDYAGAEVYLNGIFKGYTPLTLYGLVPGVYGLEFLKEGFYKKSGTVEVKNGLVCKYKLELEKQVALTTGTGSAEETNLSDGGNLSDNVDSSGSEKSADGAVALDRSNFSADRVSLFCATPSGLGIGAVPALYRYSEYGGNFVQPFFSAGTFFSGAYESGNGFDFGGVRVHGGVAFSLLEKFEFYASGVVLTGKDSIYQLNADAKYSTCFELENGTFFCLGGKIRYGYASGMYGPFGVDKGTGLGFGALCAFDMNKVNISFSEEYILSASTGDFIKKGDILKTGVAFSWRPSKSFRIGTWAALNSDFGEYVEGVSKTNFFRAVDSGLEFNTILFDAPFIISVKFKVLVFVKDLYLDYYTGELGFSYLF